MKLTRTLEDIKQFPRRGCILYYTTTKYIIKCNSFVKNDVCAGFVGSVARRTCHTCTWPTRQRALKKHFDLRRPRPNPADLEQQTDRSHPESTCHSTKSLRKDVSSDPNIEQGHTTTVHFYAGRHSVTELLVDERVLSLFRLVPNDRASNVFELNMSQSID